MPNEPISLSIPDWTSDFNPRVLERARQLTGPGRVQQLNWIEKDYVLSAVAIGSNDRPCKVRIELLPDGKDWMILESECDCPAKSRCEHAAAVLQVVAEQGLSARPLFQFPGGRAGNWLHELAAATTAPSAPKVESPTRILYILSESTTEMGSVLIVNSVKSRRRKDGRNGKTTPYSLNQDIDGSLPAFVRPEDVRVARLQKLLLGGWRSFGITAFLRGAEGAEILACILATGRCYWQDASNPPLRLGDPRPAQLIWTYGADALLSPSFQLEPAAERVFPLRPPWYLDPKEGTCGPVRTPVTDRIAEVWASGPGIRPDHIPELQGALSALASGPEAVSLPVPAQLKVRTLANIRPVPALRFQTLRLQWWESPWNYRESGGSEGLRIHVADLDFWYEQERVPAEAPESQIRRCKGQDLVIIERQLDFEKESMAQLRKRGLAPAKEILNRLGAPPSVGRWMLSAPGPDSWMEFVASHVPALLAEGWRIEAEDGVAFEVCHPEQWFLEASPAADQDWFAVELGVVIDDQRVDLLPVLLDGLRKNASGMDLQKLQACDKDRPIAITLPDGRIMPFPAGRLHAVLSTLVELYDPQLFASGQPLRLHRLRSADLSELADATQLSWGASEELRRLAEQIRNLSAFPTTDPPHGLKANLRPYQQEGLRWLQFIAACSIGGILADDMGLGKTVQTLAHLLLEKEQGRLKKPCLVVSPTSLLTTWREEAARFVPDLRVLTLHGVDRHARFADAASADLIVTTYSLLPRDAEHLLKSEFHCVVLDEAQNIKNPKTQAAQVVCQLKANHRLCLTGTPLENHLGEIWSLYNFLIPGFLGDETRFRTIFRQPIEKAGDEHRRRLLARRLKPFLLRRLKDEVAVDLPPKTEVVRKVELAGAQRDLYETIRLAMERRVREEVARSGLNRSHIVILDALLKLRQVCCDPRLVRLEAARCITESAKFGLLFDLLPTLLEEGRRILLFSQFTSMLKLIQPALEERGIPYVLLTGETDDRATPIRRFQRQEVPLFLLSLKAGGTGLTLTAADTVILYDPWWNPAVEAQATDRTHRIGQDKPVFVYRLLTVGTVEEKMEKLQARKRELVQSLLGEGTGSPLALDPADLDLLFAPISASVPATE